MRRILTISVPVLALGLSLAQVQVAGAVRPKVSTARSRLRALVKENETFAATLKGTNVPNLQLALRQHAESVSGPEATNLLRHGKTSLVVAEDGLRIVGPERSHLASRQTLNQFGIHCSSELQSLFREKLRASVGDTAAGQRTDDALVAAAIRETSDAKQHVESFRSHPDGRLLLDFQQARQKQNNGNNSSVIIKVPNRGDAQLRLDPKWGLGISLGGSFRRASLRELQSEHLATPAQRDQLLSRMLIQAAGLPDAPDRPEVVTQARASLRAQTKNLFFKQEFSNASHYYDLARLASFLSAEALLTYRAFPILAQRSSIFHPNSIPTLGLTFASKGKQSLFITAEQGDNDAVSEGTDFGHYVRTEHKQIYRAGLDSLAEFGITSAADFERALIKAAENFSPKSE